ncbi:nicotinamide N-methyltransferase [Ceratobasidium theobromae]|uniref:Protein N-terminal and lysine N-methyltransferase EFM7 n=1 Tax=Ceratobasidium theobromae TaxID=1582974 RepID=A0A5N5QCR7_9AGAM|nr:nicotinamide N-methyltransferase [Ceratobasidium theobromae]
MSDQDDFGLNNVFEEPPRPPTPPPTFTTYHRNTKSPGAGANSSKWSSINVQLVGHHVLWAQHLWNAAIVLADFLDDHSSDLCRGKTVLELGAGGALPSLVAALCGAHQVVITDYPDAPLLENIARNVDHNIPSTMRNVVKIQVSKPNKAPGQLLNGVDLLEKGYIWGTDPEKLSECLERGHISEDNNDTGTHEHPSQSGRFDVIILSDLIFNHSQHAALLDTCEATLRLDRQDESVAHKVVDSAGSELADHEGITPQIVSPCVLVFFSHHRPRYTSRDLEFFTRARGRGWVCEQVVRTKMNAMFPNDPGDEEVRSTVHGWVLRRPNTTTP